MNTLMTFFLNIHFREKISFYTQLMRCWEEIIYSESQMSAQSNVMSAVFYSLLTMKINFKGKTAYNTALDLSSILRDEKNN